jgi:hypothetical protein
MTDLITDPNEMIDGDTIADRCDVAINAPAPNRNTHLLGTRPLLVFCKTDFVFNLFDALNEIDNRHPIVLCTHNSDYAIDDELYRHRHPSIAAWYAENAFVKGCGHHRVYAIPLGIERVLGGGYSSDKQVLINQLKKPRKIINDVYMCHNNVTNLKERTTAEAHFGGHPWCTHDPHGIQFADYIARVHSHRFVVCPHGNGMDSHRMWEALYMGVTPILKRNDWSEQWEDMAVLVNDWKDFYPGEHFQKEFDTNRLTVSHWIRQMRAELQKHTGE